VVGVEPDRSSLLLGAPPPGPAPWHDREKRAESPVDRSRVRKSGCHVGLEDNHVCSRPVPGYVLTADTATEVILGPHRVSVSPTSSSLLHRSVSLGGWPAAR